MKTLKLIKVKVEGQTMFDWGFENADPGKTYEIGIDMESKKLVCDGFEFDYDDTMKELIREELVNRDIGFKFYADQLPEKTQLYWFDYRDDLETYHEQIGESIREGTMDKLWMELDKGMYGMESAQIDNYMDDLGLNSLDDLWDDVRYEIQNRDESDILGDLWRNTRDFVCFYDTGIEIESRNNEVDVRYSRMKIKKFFGLKGDKYDNEIDIMLSQGHYHGGLYIYFNLNKDLFYSLTNNNIEDITFENFMFGVVCHEIGGGDVMENPIKEKITLPFDRQNVFLEKEIKWNWTYEIAGMVSDWAESTKVGVVLGEESKSENGSPTGELQAQEKQYKETFKSGKCTFGDMDMNRHRNVAYRNEFPCGNKCSDCGTFWID